VEATSQDSEVLGGELVFAGTRVPVMSLFDHLEGGDSIKHFLEGFPSVRREQVETVLEDADDLAAVARRRGEPAGVQHSRDEDRSPRRPTDTVAHEEVVPTLKAAWNAEIPSEPRSWEGVFLGLR
jgi:uncharacterized protein (DUF433 family)